jgi:hypothetical protein
MSRYGVSIYGLSVYGPDTPVAYAASGFTATPTDYGTILLKWTNPIGNWSKIKLVRNTYGFPIDYLDGTVLDIKKDGKYEAYKETSPPSYLDTNLATNAFYYYSLFVFERINYKWIRVADIIGLSVKDYGYSDKLFEYVPDVYKISSLTQAGGYSQAVNVSSVDENEILKKYLTLFGFELNKYHTLTNLLFSRYDTSKLNGLLLPSLLQELGLEYEPEIGYQQARILTRDAVALYKGKGSRDGLREFLKAFTGYAVPTIAAVPNPTVDGVTVGANKMLDYNDSSFEESIGHWVSGTNAALACLKVKKISTVSLTSNVLTLTIGAHDYKVGNKIYVFGFDKPLFNQTTSVSITAITATSVSFALTGTDYPSTTAWNPTTNAFPTIAPYPNPWVESTAPTNYPNLQKGILAVKNTNASAGTVKILCGSSAPITKGIPVTAGLAYSFSVYTVNSTTTRLVTAGIDWYNRFGVYISSIAGTATASGTGVFSTRVSVVASGINVAPATAYYAVPTISIAGLDGSASTEFQYFDCAEFEQSAAITAFEDARQLRFTLKANRINELANPHFASPITPWTVTGATPSVITSTREPEATVWEVAYKSLTSNVARIETQYTHDYKVGQSIVVSGVDATFNGVYTITAVGERTTSNYPYIEYAKTATDVARANSTGTVWVSGNALKLIASAAGTVVVKSWDGSTAGQRMPIHYPETPYTFSVYAQLSASGAENLTPYITWYTSTGATSNTTGSTTSVTTTSPDWVRLEVTGTAPIDAHSAIVTVDWVAANGEILYLDSALFENAPVAFTYFDGASGYGDNPDYVWEGSANASRSHYYKNRYSIQVRTANATFKDKLPMGTTVALYLGQPNT